MRESFSLHLALKRDPSSNELRLKYYMRIFNSPYGFGSQKDVPIWRFIINDTLYYISHMFNKK